MDIPSGSVLDQPLRVFISYSHKDAEWLDALVTHLAMLRNDNLIQPWTDRDISAGDEWKDEIDENLKLAHLVLMLVSPDFLASDYCHNIEMKVALARHEEDEACVVPIILRPCEWTVSMLGKLQALPVGGQPISKWGDRDEAFLSVAQGLRKVIKARGSELGNRKPALVLLKEGLHLKEMGEFAEARTVLRTALRRLQAKHTAPHPDVVKCLIALGESAFHLDDFQGACSSFKEALQLNETLCGAEHPQVALCLQNLSAVLREQKSFAAARAYAERALLIFEANAEAFQLNLASTLNNLGNIAFDQGQFAEAQRNYEKALVLDRKAGALSPDPTVVPITINNLGKALHYQGNFAQARVLYHEALSLFSELVKADHPFIEEVERNLAQLPSE